MKKTFLLGLMLLIMSLALTGCGDEPKEALTSEEFTQYCEANEFVCKDWTNNYRNVPAIESVDKAHYYGENGVEYYLFVDEDNAAKYADYFADILKEKVAADGSTVSEKNKNGDNYSSHIFETEEHYAYISRVEESVLIIMVYDKDCMEVTENFIKGINY